jgi:two-component system cell cycle sensor histidine kinase/response regulator CckA
MGPKHAFMKAGGEPSLVAESAFVALRENSAESQAQFNILAETTPAAVFVYQNQRIIFANRAAEQLSGYSRQEISDNELGEFLAPEFRRSMRLELHNESPHSRYEMKFTAGNGEERWLDVMTSPLSYEGGAAVLAVAMDITARKATEKSLSVQNAYLEKLFESAPEAIVIIDNDSVILRANRKFEALFGYPRGEILGKVLEPLIVPAHKLQETLWLSEKSKQGEDINVETVRHRRDGKLVDVAVLVTPVDVGEGQVHYCIYRDITDRKHNEQLQRALYRISEQAAAAEDLDGFYQSIHQIVGELIPAKNFYIGLWDPVTQRIALPYFRDEIAPLPPEPLRSGKGLTEYVLRTGQPLLATPEVIRKLVEAGEIQPVRDPCMVWLGVPLKIGSTVIGVLAVLDRFEYVNQALVKMLGYDSEEELLRLKLSTDVYVNPEHRKRLVAQHRNTREIASGEMSWKRKDGQVIQVRAAGRSRTGESGETIGFEMIVEDVTERRSLEEQLRQSQKMEAVGRLAGGIAHDFNNLLTVVKGYSELMLQDMQEEHPLRQDVHEIKKAADRAVGLTRQLLAFSRRQMMEARVLDLNAVIVNMDKLLRPLLREDIEQVFLLQPHLSSIKADPGQIEQVIMNLAVNSRDAMPKGGRLTIETSEADVRGHADMEPGKYVMLAVSDTGLGMDENTRRHAFEPFFTTKEIGKGTGLGLSTVYGIVKQSGGYVWIHSAPYQGTTFKIYLPRVAASAAAPAKIENAPTIAAAAETVLLVEDEDAVRALVRVMLERKGYTVLDARDGAEALKICGQHPAKIDLLITDVVLEHMSGRELAEKLVGLRPTMKTLYVSGYTDDAIVQHGVLTSDISFLQKPFDADALVAKVQQLLKSPS